MRASGYAAPTRPNPDDALGDVLGLALFGLGGLIAFAWWRGRSQAGGEDVNYPSGGVQGVATSGASGTTAPTSHPTGHGQLYV